MCKWVTDLLATYLALDCNDSDLIVGSPKE